MAVRMPDRRQPNAPPPLPPPRYVDEGHPKDDRRQDWGHAPSHKGPPAGQKSPSDVGLSFPKSWGRQTERRLPERFEYGQGSETSCPSIESMMRPPTDSDRRYEAQQPQDEGYYSVSGPGPLSQPLPGEKQLHHRDQEKSSQAYDKNLLSKIGKPSTTPPRSSTFNPGSVESSSSPPSDPPIKQEPLSSRYIDTPHSRPLSPLSATSATSAKGFMDYRSPKMEHLSRSSTLDSDFPSPTSTPQRFPTSNDFSRQQKSRRSGSGSLLSQFDESAYNTTNEVKREKYEPPFPAETDSTFRMEETVRHLRIDDRSPLQQYHSETNQYRTQEPFRRLHSQPSRSGILKRKMPPEGPSEEAQAQMRASFMQQTAASAEQYSIDTPPQQQHLTAQDANRYAQNQGSISSQSSAGYRQNSYASSGGPSVGDSSYTSMDQHSPGGLSPSSDQPSYPHLNPREPQYSAISMNATSPNARSGPYPQHHPVSDHDSTPTRTTKENARKQTSSKGGPPFECHCCPKRPQKFETQEALQRHKNEKQYECQYCHNKFKNKNEAERHQNSIHRRTNSWSCGVIANDYAKAFFISPHLTAVPHPTSNQQNQSPTHNGLIASDFCGYCGEEFSREPVNWDERQHHLKNAHKFGECNQGKKFYRADHFRQHLKHSHGGKSGKHTNSLEQTCLRDEAPQIASDSGSQSSTPTQLSSAPIANMGNLPAGSQAMSSAAGLEQLNMATQAQMQQPMNMGPQQGNMAPPPMVSMEMTNIDPSINYMAPSHQHPQHQHTQQQQHPAMQMQGAGGGVGYGGGGGYKAEEAH
ncbi:MAG: hypothetical protein OHK93_006463 [Ramalina farinacea]|uniref:C2H2-type domain-containing protein n=1 Tax=Ramalina farinacea TaxID=258253 RepID=A0AA43QK97_9LECA|nr:hypothetical protein [Ramalina farinacea]